MSGTEREDEDRVWSEATGWFARMRSPDAEQFRPQFEDWLGRCALHRRLYNRAAEHWMHGTLAFAEERARIHGASTQSPPKPQRPGRRRATIAALVAASAVATGSAFLLDHHQGHSGVQARPSTSIAADPLLVAAAGEQRAMRLADGSLITLASDTVLQLRFSDSVRRLDLERGRARFDVAHERRPFMVLAGGGSVTAHGTIFEVGLMPDRRVSVRLVRGSVDVSLPPTPEPGAKTRSRRLLPGEAITFAAAGPAPNGVGSRAAVAGTAHEYRDASLADIVSEANRHAAVPIRFAQADIGRWTVTGRFSTDDASLLADRLATLFDLVVDRSSSGEIVLRTR